MDRTPNKSWRRLVAPTLAALMLLVGCYGLMDAGRKSPAVTLTRGPDSQSVTSTAAYGSTINDATPIAHHALTLTAATPTQTTFSFVAFGDTRLNPIAHQQVVSSILSLAPSFVLHTGDFVSDGNDPAQWATFYSIEHDLSSQIPFYGVLGNHEGGDPCCYFDHFDWPNNERWYSFDHENVHVIALEIDGYTAYAPDSPQIQWLKNDLAHTSQQWKVVFFHIPPYSSGSGHGSDLSVRAVMEPLFRQYGVDLVFNGHDHDYERSVANGITYIVTGGGGAPLHPERKPPDPASVYFTMTYHSVQVSVTGTTLAVAGVRPDGVRFDEFTLRKPSAR